MNEPKYPHIRVPLSTNAITTVVRVEYALEKEYVATKECDQFVKEALSGDYDHFIRTVVAWVRVTQEEKDEHHD